MSDLINTTLDDMFTHSSPMGSLESSLQTMLYGIDHRQVGLPVPQNKEGYGLVFFTRPQLNLTKENCRADRRFIPLLTTESVSMQRAIRSYLDPRLHYEDITCPLVDPYNPFIPLLGNTVTSLTGWLSLNVESYTSKPDAYKGSFSFIDSTTDFNAPYTLSANFRNIIGDPITSLFMYWVLYATNVFEGSMLPYADYLMNRIDYNTRIWVVVMDWTLRYVQKIGCTGAAYPTGIDLARAYDYTREQNKPFNDHNKEVAIQFQCNGARYNDPYLVHAFNQTSEIFNPDMWVENRSKSMQKIPYAALKHFNGQGYPRINPITSEMEWYVPKARYKSVMTALSRHMSALGSSAVPASW